MTEKRTRQRKGDIHYVNNEEFTKQLDSYSQKCRLAAENNTQEPRMNNYLGACIMKMAERLSLSPRFRNYPFREEMVGNAIVAAVRYAKNFDGNRFNNGFAYITQVLFSHMVQTIKKEKQMYRTNIELIQQARLDVFGDSELSHEAAAHAQMIADQKLEELEKQKDETKTGGFKLRTGYNKEERAKMVFTPVERD